MLKDMETTRKVEKAETKSQDGGLKFQFTRYADAQGKWVRHGDFRAFYPDGTVASQGHYQDGREHGPWKDFHDNGKVAAEGTYKDGREHGTWKYYGIEGELEQAVEFVDGVEQGKKKARAKK